MKAIDVLSAASITPISSSSSSNIILDVDALRSCSDMFQLPPMDKNQTNVLDEIFDATTSSSLDYCDNQAQIEVLKHHYTNEFGGTDQEVLRDYREDSIIHKVVDDMPSTYRGRSGALNAWHDLSSHFTGTRGSNNHCNFDLTHISVCRNHAQVNWKAECSEENNTNTNNKHMTTMFGTDSFTFDDSNHIKMQTTVALSEK